MRLLLLTFLAAADLAVAADSPLDFLNHNRPVLDAHNCYPYDGKWADRIDRALSVGYPIGIEQDLAWYEGKVVVTHSSKGKAGDPGLREHFFERVRPSMEKALKDGDRAKWPLIVLHFDFKSNERPLIEAVWKMLGEYEGWITTAVKGRDAGVLAPMAAGPLLVLTEESDEQEAVFFGAVAVGEKLRIFGSAHTGKVARAELVTAAPSALLGERPTNYRRWWNSSWWVVEEGGQRKAGDWTAADAGRLKALVDHAHGLGFWIRFYTLDGFGQGEDQGWGPAYNFGSRAAVRERWKAVLGAGVNLMATDQYEELGAFMREK